jgi:pantothenate kinase type III
MDSKTLWVDIGNSSISWKFGSIYTTVSIEDFDKKILPNHIKSIVSCVGDSALITNFNNPQIVTTKPYPNLIFNYNLDQLGVDRYLAIIAGFNLHPNTNLMIIDIGTCITLDYIIDNQHHSGGITPGMNLMQGSFEFQGDDSKSAWESGIEQMIQVYLLDKINNFKSKILITGGGQGILKTQNKSVNYAQNLVITGLRFL